MIQISQSSKLLIYDLIRDLNDSLLDSLNLIFFTNHHINQRFKFLIRFVIQMFLIGFFKSSMVLESSNQLQIKDSIVFFTIRCLNGSLSDLLYFHDS